MAPLFLESDAQHQRSHLTLLRPYYAPKEYGNSSEKTSDAIPHSNVGVFCITVIDAGDEVTQDGVNNAAVQKTLSASISRNY